MKWFVAWFDNPPPDSPVQESSLQGVFTAYTMLLIAVSYRRCGWNLRTKLYTIINSLSA